MVELGTVAQIWRFPVKSMGGEQVEALELGPGGAVGDRVLAVVDPAARKVLSGKRWPDLMLASARWESDEVVITLPDGTELEAGDPGVHAALSAWLDPAVRLGPPPADGVWPMEMHTGMSDEDTPLFDWPGPPGTWLDLADAHFLTTASLASIAQTYEGDFDVRRFRPTALVEAPADDPWPEEGWGAFEVGDVACELLMPTPRCTIPSRAQPGLARDKGIGRAIRDHHENNLGIYASVNRAGTLRVGDPVRRR